ncbi:aldo/keto reductase [Paraburkholderia caribensis]|uniref:aldo/keto reductase n=1 Tax=Paraburkholderia caribensis TaxID=75105 RepID=UPI001CAFE61A|nr:aldo/keto reductase [Paraburkholderia caribensis]CAG9263158.1 1-deoxyxylulose-5-phosphate synthase YajO [Paraburkholderia caribensis]
MEYATLGRSGVKVSKICLGMMSYGSPDWQKWVLPKASGEHFVRRALDSGVNFFDTADFYSYGESEQILGDTISNLASRHEVVICTKVGLPMGSGVNGGGLSRKAIRSRVEDSLRRLRTDYIDIYLLHEPDPLTPLEETLDAMHDLVREGKVLYAGASNYPAWAMAKLAYASRYGYGRRWSVAQIQYNLCYREDERDVLPLCDSEGMGVMVYSPLARGWLASPGTTNASAMSAEELKRLETDLKARSLYGNDSDIAVRACLAKLAERRGVSMSCLAMSWVMSRPSVTSMLCGVLQDKHLDEAIAALELKLTADEILELNAAYRPQALKDTGLGAVLQSGTKSE